MSLYKVPIIGDGKTPETAFRPDVPDDVAWAACHIDPEQGYCVIEVPDRKADLSESPAERIYVPAGFTQDEVVEAVIAEIIDGAGFSVDQARKG